MEIKLLINGLPLSQYLSSLLFSSKIRIGFTAIVGILLIFITTIYIQDKEQDLYKDPLRVGLYFSQALITRDVELGTKEIRAFSDASISSKIDSIKLQESRPYSFRPTLTNYKRINSKILATYSYIEQDMKKAWHVTVILEPVGKLTWKEQIGRIELFGKYIFGFLFHTSLSGYPMFEDRWLVTDFYSNDRLDVTEFDKLVEESNERFNNQTIEELSDMKEFDREQTFLDRFFDIEIIKQNDETRDIYNEYFKEVYLQ